MNVAKEKRIFVIGGDGIGPEVMGQAVRLLSFFRDQRGLPLSFQNLDLGADRYLRDGSTLPTAIFAKIEAEADAILLGALGDPRVPDSAHAHDILFGLRFGLDLFANIRPVCALSTRLIPLRDRTKEDVQFTVFRENTEGIYAGLGGQFKRFSKDEIGINEDINTRKGVERIIRAAFEFAKLNELPTIHLADKSNAMRFAHELWRRTFYEVAPAYPSISASAMYVDAMAHALIQDPSQFRVIVTCNLFGDILTDIGAALQGGLGMAASASVHPGRRVGLFEPVHGSAPTLAGKDEANPFASFLTAGMLLAHLGYAAERNEIECAVAEAVEQGQCTKDIGGVLGTRGAADAVLARLAENGVAQKT